MTAALDPVPAWWPTLLGVLFAAGVAHVVWTATGPRALLEEAGSRLALAAAVAARLPHRRAQREGSHRERVGRREASAISLAEVGQAGGVVGVAQWPRSAVVVKLCLAVPITRDAGNYGMIIPCPSDSLVEGLIEKPEPSASPSTRASIGRYLLKPDIFDTLRALPPGAGGEIQLADAIDAHARRGEVEAVMLDGRRFDCGSQEGFVAATLYEYARRGGKIDMSEEGC